MGILSKFMMGDVVVVHHDVAVLDTLKYVFDDDMVNITYTSSGTEALQLVQDNAVAVVLSSTQLFDVNGLEVIKRVKETSPLTRRIVLGEVTDMLDASVLINELEVDALFSRPINYSRLFSKVLDCVNEFGHRVNQAQFQSVFERFKIGYLVLDDERNIVEADAGLETILAVKPESTVSMPVKEFIGSDDEKWDQMLHMVGRWHHDVPLIGNSDSTCSICTLSAAGRSGNQCSLCLVADFEGQIPASQKDNEVGQDPLTHLPNRLILEDQVDSLFERRRCSNETFGALFIDIDKFKDVNDQYGHSAGDEVIKAFGERVKASLRKMDFLCRYGGDEFVALLPKCGSQANINMLCEKLISALQQPIVLPSLNTQIIVKASIGGVVINRDIDSFEGLIDEVDTRMYQAKHAGGNGFVV